MQQEGDYRNNKFTFGYLNTAQDRNDIEDDGLAVLQGVDLDALALGTVRSSNYVSAGSGPPDWTTANIVGENFIIYDGKVNKTSTNGWIPYEIDTYLTPPDAPSISIAVSNGGVALSDSSTWTGFADGDVKVSISDGGVRPILSGKVTIDPSSYNQTTRSFSYEIRIKNGGTQFERKLNGEAAFSGSYDIDGSSGSNVGYHDVDYSVYICMDSAETYTDGDIFSFSISNNVLEDGDYHYLISSVVTENGTEIESLYSPATRIAIKNENYLGQQISYNKAEITVDRDMGADKWLYRKGPRDKEWFRIAIILHGSGSTVIVDDITEASITDGKIISDISVSSMQDLLDSVGSSSWSHIFEKDNRLWAVPNEKQTVVFFSEPLEWWKWSKNNSLGFNGDFRGIAHIRDDKNVQISNTAAIVTSNGLYNVYGTGTEKDPYIRIEHEKNFGTVADSLVKANNVLYMVSDGSNYEDGEWGRKLYSYDLTTLTELSAIVQKSNPFINDVKPVTYVNQIGGNKIKILMDDGTMMIYHILGNGFGESSDTLESSGNWSVQSKTYYPKNSYAGKFQNSDRLRIEYSGEIDIIYVVDGVDQPTITLLDVARGKPVEISVPPTMGMNYSVKINGKNGAILYDAIWVKES